MLIQINSGLENFTLLREPAGESRHAEAATYAAGDRRGPGGGVTPPGHDPAQKSDVEPVSRLADFKFAEHVHSGRARSPMKSRILCRTHSSAYRKSPRSAGRPR